MSRRLKTFLQYSAILGITALLVVVSLRGLNVGEGESKWDYLSKTWAEANKGWLTLMAILALLSHVVRAQRWIMLLEPIGHHPKLSNSFYSLMVGYLVNLVIPRGGEISRCYNLYKLDKIPVVESFGTVVVERIIDLLCLLLLVALSFAFETGKLFDFIDTLPFHFDGSNKIMTLLIIGAVGIFLLFAAFWVLKRNVKARALMTKTWTSFAAGLRSVQKLRQKKLFIVYSLLIWFLYFAMSYTVLKAFPATAGLNLTAVLSLFAIGAIAMAAPLPGGTGSYHVLVPQGLTFLYGLSLSDAVAFTFIFHAWQTAILIVLGAMSLILTSVIVKRKAAGTSSQQE